jgi:hypothetical protein
LFASGFRRSRTRNRRQKRCRLLPHLDPRVGQCTSSSLASGSLSPDAAHAAPGSPAAGRCPSFVSTFLARFVVTICGVDSSAPGTAATCVRLQPSEVRTTSFQEPSSCRSVRAPAGRPLVPEQLGNQPAVTSTDPLPSFSSWRRQPTVGARPPAGSLASAGELSSVLLQSHACYGDVGDYGVDEDEGRRRRGPGCR